MLHILKYLFIGSLLFVSSCKSLPTPQVLIQEFPVKGVSIRALQVVDSQTLYWAGSNGYYGYTKDGGKTWTQKRITYKDSIHPHFRSIAYNGKSIFLLSIESPALLYKLTGDKAELLYTETHKKAFYDALIFSKNGLGVAMGDPTDDCLSVLISRDNGTSWRKVSCSKLPKTDTGEAAFAASNGNIKIIGNKIWLVSGGTKSRVFQSENAGKTWRVFDTPIVQGKASEGIYAMDFYDTRHGCIIGGDYTKPLHNDKNIALTQDGGRTWQLVAIGKEPDYKSAVQYVPGSKGKELIAVGKTGISYSKDSGKTWHQISDAAFFSIRFVDKHSAWLGGAEKLGFLRF